MDSSNCNVNYKLEAIKAAIADGSLSKEEINKRLTFAIHKENEKRSEERDSDFVMACETILYEMHTGHPYVSRKEESKQALKKRLDRKRRFLRSASSPRMIKRVLLVTGALVIVAVGTDILLRHQWLEGDQSPDEQQYVISGQEVDPGLVDEGVADDTWQEKTVTTTDLSEAEKVLGLSPHIPSWLPDGWTVENYYVRIASAITFRIKYHNNQNDGLLRFSIIIYPDTEKALREFEQTKAGTVTLCNDWDVYIAKNVDRCIAVWQANTTCYSLSGPITSDDVVQMINSIQRSE